MRIALIGVACVGKSTIGELLAGKWGYTFIDFDQEVKARMNTSISKLMEKCFNDYEYRQKVKHILPQILLENKDNMVIAMPPFGLFREFLTIFREHNDVLTVALKDKAKNILSRTFFTDDDDNIINEEIINDGNRHLYYEEIKKDISYYYTSLRKADLQFNINGMNANDATKLLAEQILIRKGEDYGTGSSLK